MANGRVHGYDRRMTAPTPYLLFPGFAAEALEFYRGIFGGEVRSFTYEQFDRTDGPPSDIAHGQLDGPVTLFASDAGGDEDAVHMVGMYLALLGAADPDTARAWFDALAADGRVIEPLEKRSWGDWDGTLVDRFGVRWLIGFQDLK